LPKVTRKTLTDLAIRAAVKAGNAVRLTDGEGLSLLISPGRAPAWRIRYHWQGREKGLSLGLYPETSLAQARETHADMRKMVRKGVDPSAVRKAAKVAAAGTMQAQAEAYFRARASKLSPGTLTRDKQAIAKLLKPFGSRSVASITGQELLTELRRIGATGTLESMQRAGEVFSRISREAIGAGHAERDVFQDIKRLLTTPTQERRAAIINPEQLAGLLNALDGYKGQPEVAAALRLLPLLMLRPGELRGMRWSELENLDRDAPLLRIPAERMKPSRGGGRHMHLVPLPRQAVSILRHLRPLTGLGPLVFPGVRTSARPISINTLNAALRRMGYTGEEQTSHGFRRTASTLLNEMGEDVDLIERCLAHVTPGVRGVYDASVKLDARRALLQRWADYLDRLRTKPGENE
jgi:integrase